MKFASFYVLASIQILISLLGRGYLTVNVQHSIIVSVTY